MYFVVIFSFLFTYIKQNKRFLFLKIIFLKFWLICMRVNHDFFCYPHPDQRFLKWIRIHLDPAQWYGSNRIRNDAFPPLMIFFFFFVLQKRKWTPKPLLRCQNLVTKAGGCRGYTRTIGGRRGLSYTTFIDGAGKKGIDKQ